jgi:hypothetical protein
MTSSHNLPLGDGLPLGFEYNAKTALQWASRQLLRLGMTKRVLFACHNGLMATHLAEIHHLLKDDPRLSFHVVRRPSEYSEGEFEAIQQALPLPTHSLLSAYFNRWDLIVLADHPGAFRCLANPRLRSVLRISHGVGSKLVSGSDYLFGPRMRDSLGRPYFSCMFESSTERVNQMVTLQPDLKGIIRLVGSSQIDALAMARATRQRQASPLGGRRRVLFASSWGEGNLFQKNAPSLSAELLRLGTQADIVLRPHPNLYSSHLTPDQTWRTVFQHGPGAGIRFSAPDEALSAAFAWADVLVIDDLSSVALMAACVGLPLVLMPSESPKVGKDCFVRRLIDLVPIAPSPENLGRAIDRALSEPPHPELAELAKTINSIPGESGARMRQEIYRLLDLEPIPTRA